MSSARRRPRREGPSHSPAGKPGLAARQAAQRLLSAIVDARTPMDALTDDTHGHPHYLALDARDRSLVRAILMAALRHRGDLEALVTRFTERPLPDGAASLRAIIHVALAQILFLDVPNHSATDLAVAAAQADPRNRRFAGLVNALCRRAIRECEAIRAEIETQPVRAPQWFADRLEAVYGADRARAIEAVHRREAPIDLTLKDRSPANIAARAQTLDAWALPTGSLRLRHGTEIAALPGFDEGAFWVQDAAAAIPARLFGEVSGRHVADLCAAPGGKTAQLAALGAKVTAVDQSANRLKRLRANLDRLDLSQACETVAASLFDFTPDRPFDAVLLDAPCSSTGTVRRHPDVPWTKSDADIVKLADLQARMLARAATLVAPGGLLVFANCSLDPREGEDVARAFAADQDSFTIDAVSAAELPGLEDCLTAEGFVRTTPADLPAPAGEIAAGGVDGFFAARFRRTV
ncbi:RsmB/NOP family class I SAM-dependent RNA methyltransferase [Roseitalea porphyridii]|uniref:RsmB/NOP family class I SAM-dependent RNA methyltransferase n=1 Tax=Roseitalea porphyridii TaxID=1852022 RepID=UPI001FCEC272|nr:RsmB/NOP family class I SAM-dependent RNA methyltransferase [Roseitalea porphyridii]